MSQKVEQLGMSRTFSEPCTALRFWRIRFRLHPKLLLQYISVIVTVMDWLNCVHTNESCLSCLRYNLINHFFAKFCRYFHPNSGQNKQHSRLDPDLRLFGSVSNLLKLFQQRNKFNSCNNFQIPNKTLINLTKTKQPCTYLS